MTNTEALTVIDPRDYAPNLPRGDEAIDSTAVRWAFSQWAASPERLQLHLPGGDWYVDGPLAPAAGVHLQNVANVFGAGRNATRFMIDDSVFPVGRAVFEFTGTAESFVGGADGEFTIGGFGVIAPTRPDKNDPAAAMTTYHAFDLTYAHRVGIADVKAQNIPGSFVRYNVAYDNYVLDCSAQKCGDPRGTGNPADGIAATEGWGVIHEYRAVNPERWCANNDLRARLQGNIGWGLVFDGTQNTPVNGVRFEGPAQSDAYSRGSILMHQASRNPVTACRFGQIGLPLGLVDASNPNPAAHVKLIDSAAIELGGVWSKVLGSEWAVHALGSTRAVEIGGTINGAPGRVLLDDTVDGLDPNRINPLFD